MAENPRSETIDRYCAFQRGDEFGFAIRDNHAEVMRALLDRGRCEPVTAMGRGALYTFPVLLDKGVLREYRRGGVMQRFLREGSLTNRPLREWEVLNRLFDAGFPVPEPLGVLWRRRGVLYTGAIATRYVDAVPLSEYLLADTDSSASLLERTGTLIRGMHDLNVFHADLHVGNILVAAKADAREPIHFVDFDNARITALSQLDRARNLLRLRRSFLKRGLRMSDFECMLRGYGPIAVPEWLALAYELKGAASDAIQRRFGTYAV